MSSRHRSSSCANNSALDGAFAEGFCSILGAFQMLF